MRLVCPRSLGGYVVQVAALRRLDLVRRLIVAASGPGRVPGSPDLPDRVAQILNKPHADEEDYLYTFWAHSDDGRHSGRASQRRLHTRLSESRASISDTAVDGQRAATFAFGAGVWNRLGELTLPVLVANGARDILIDTYGFASYQASQRLPNAKVVLYSDAGHAFLFQRADDFGREVLSFLG
jgi:pimeloyl-ACP methyl ester carboxylesterase